MPYHWATVDANPECNLNKWALSAEQITCPMKLGNYSGFNDWINLVGCFSIEAKYVAENDPKDNAAFAQYFEARSLRRSTVDYMLGKR